MTNQEDHNYIDQVLKGNINAFSFLVQKYQNMVFTMALRIVKNREEAEDVAQESFIKCYNSLSKFKGEAKFSTWIYKIVYHTSLDRLKIQKRTSGSEIIDDLNEGDVEHVENILDYMENQERSEIIKNAISQLNPEEQMIITLYYFEERSLKEIAEVVDISMDNIKIKLFRSRKRLFTILKGRLEPSIEKL